MSWIRIAVAGLALCAGATVASAQGNPGGAESQGRGSGMRGEGRQAMLFAGITLTPAQQERIDAIRAKYRAERGKVRPSSVGGGRLDSAARASMMAMTTRQNSEIRAVLNAEQQRVFDRNIAEQKKRRDQMRANRA